MKQFAALLLLASCFTLHAEAQSFLDDLQEKKRGEGTVTVNQSKFIDELVNNAKLKKSSPVTTRPNNNSTTTDHTRNNTQTQTTDGNADNTARNQYHTTTGNVTEEASSTVTTKKIMRNSRKITGYRVQAYAGGNSRNDRQKAENIGNAIKMRFPDLPVYVHFYSPRWICRVGNFRTYEEANNVLKEIKDMGYSQACIVKGKITVGY